MVPVHVLLRLHNPRSGRNNCSSNNKQTRLQSELASSSTKVSKKQRAPDPEFRFTGNKKQYELNRDVVEKIDEALESVDADERSAKLNEGKDLLTERNKHILLAEKYGWDTVACYTAEPLATDSDDEKRIRKAVKESKQMRDEKKRSATAKQKAKGGVPRQFTERRVFVDRPATTPPVAGKFPSSREVRCFRCFRQGHFCPGLPISSCLRQARWERTSKLPTVCPVTGVHIRITRPTTRTADL